MNYMGLKGAMNAPYLTSGGTREVNTNRVGGRPPDRGGRRNRVLQGGYRRLLW
jgi:hypothetical protein